MLLVIDIGNTNIVLGVFQGDRLKHSWRVSTRREQTADEYGVLVRNLFELADSGHESFEAIVISSVVPPLNDDFELLCRRYFDLDPVFVGAEKQSLISVRYEPVSDVGADRIVTAVAARKMVGSPVIVVDFGTATTFDAVSKNGEYLGGIIAPGIGISAEALFSRASRLPRIEIRKPQRVIGASTVASMQSGIYYGYAGLVEGVLKRMRDELGPAPVIATGGLARLIAEEVPLIQQVEENLMLYGLQQFHDHSAQG